MDDAMRTRRVDLEPFAVRARRRAFVAVLLVASASACGTTGSAARPSPLAQRPPELPGWTLVWHEEFDGPALDPATWNVDQGSYTDPNELQYFAGRPENVRVEDGWLIIEARKAEQTWAEYSSARITTIGKMQFTHGRLEVRMQVPGGKGLWPSFWLEGADLPRVGWPRCSTMEIESRGREPATIYARVFGDGYANGYEGLTRGYTLDAGTFTDAPHAFALEWEAGAVRWYADGVLFRTLTPAELPTAWPYDKPFHLGLRVAVGGVWPGDPDASTRFPARLRVDYIRYYRRTP